MARAVRDGNLGSRNARLALPASAKPHYRTITTGLALGYKRTGGDAGRWIARRYTGDRRYAIHTIGLADDHRDANGIDVLTFAEAQKAAAVWADAETRRERGMEAPAGPYTVTNACGDYLDWMRAHRKSAHKVGLTIERHILPAMGKKQVARLTTAEIRKWHGALAASPKLGRGGRATKTWETADPVERERRRKSTANRVLTILRGALNFAFREGKVPSDAAWRRVKPFAGVEGVRLRYLSEDECRRLLNATEGAFRTLARAAIETGCRYGELICLRVDDFHPDGPALRIRDSKSGRARFVPLDEQAARFVEGVAAGRKGAEPLFRRDDGEAWQPSQQLRPMEAASARAKLDPPATFHALRHSFASNRVMRGMPIQVVAQILGHSTTRMVEMHYGHLAQSYVKAALEQTTIVLDDEPSNVTPLRR